jgi:hypothetical protein
VLIGRTYSSLTYPWAKAGDFFAFARLAAFCNSDALIVLTAATR